MVLLPGRVPDREARTTATSGEVVSPYSLTVSRSAGTARRPRITVEKPAYQTVLTSVLPAKKMMINEPGVQSAARIS